MNADDISICGLLEVEDVAASFHPTHLLSLIEPGRRMRRPDTINRKNHLIMMFQDTWNADLLLAPTPEHMSRIDAWVESLPEGSRLLIHCFAGVGRSPGVGLGILAKSMPLAEAVAKVLEIRPEALPNPLIVKLWDHHLGLGGQLLAALEKNLGFTFED